MLVGAIRELRSPPTAAATQVVGGLATSEEKGKETTEGGTRLIASECVPVSIRKPFLLKVL